MKTKLDIKKIIEHVPKVINYNGYEELYKLISSRVKSGSKLLIIASAISTSAALFTLKSFVKNAESAPSNRAKSSVLTDNFTDEENLKVGIVHIPSNKFGEPGEELPMEIRLTGTQNFEYELRVNMVHDGKLLQLSIPNGTLDLYDRPTYKFKHINPSETLSYYFEIFSGKKRLAKSKKFVVKRSCKPSISKAVPPVADIHVAGMDQKTLSTTSYRLGQEVKMYENSIKLLDKIQELVKGIANEQ